MNWKDIVWPWGALKRERAAKWLLVQECNDMRHAPDQSVETIRNLNTSRVNLQSMIYQTEGLADKQAAEIGILRRRIEAYEATLKTAMFRDPKTGRLLKKVS